MKFEIEGEEKDKEKTVRFYLDKDEDGDVCLRCKDEKNDDDEDVTLCYVSLSGGKICVTRFGNISVNTDIFNTNKHGNIASEVEEEEEEGCAENW